MNVSPSVRVESAAQLALMLGVGSVAACASWSHVVDLAEQNGQTGWLAVADAAVLETLAVSMGLDVRRRRRNGESTRFALCVLVAAVVLQLAAQVAQAPITFWGWTMAALPAVGFLLLVKVAMARVVALPAASTQVPATMPAAAPGVEAAVEVAGAVARKISTDDTTPPRDAAAPTTDTGTSTETDLLSAGRDVAADLARHDASLTRASLVAGLRGRGLRVGTGRAGDLLATLRAEHARTGQDHHDRHLSSVGARL